MTTEVFQVAPGTVLVHGYEISGDNQGWKSLRFAHKRTRVVDDPIRGLHLKVPFKYLGTIRYPIRFWRVSPRAKVGEIWLGRRVEAVSIEANPDRSPPWQIRVVFATASPEPGSS